MDSYLPDLVLQGVQEDNFRGSLSTDLKFTLQVNDLNNQCTVSSLMIKLHVTGPGNSLSD